MERVKTGESFLAGNSFHTCGLGSVVLLLPMVHGYFVSGMLPLVVAWAGLAWTLDPRWRADGSGGRPTTIGWHSYRDRTGWVCRGLELRAASNGSRNTVSNYIGVRSMVILVQWLRVWQ